MTSPKATAAQNRTAFNLFLARARIGNSNPDPAKILALIVRCAAACPKLENTAAYIDVLCGMRMLAYHLSNAGIPSPRAARLILDWNSQTRTPEEFAAYNAGRWPTE